MSEFFIDKKKVIDFSLIFSVVVVLVFLFFKKISWAVGISLGTGAGLWNFHLLYKDFSGLFRPPDQVEKRENLSSSQAGSRQFSLVAKFFFRYLLLALLFLAAFYIPGVHFMGFVLGFFFVHVNLGLVSFLRLMRQDPKK